MKKLLFIAAGFILAAGAMAQTSKPDDFVKFNTNKHDFGKIKQAVPATYYFEITNTSNKQVANENAGDTCGCAVPEYPEEPLSPVRTAKIKGQYDAAKGGHCEDTVLLKLAGGQERKALALRGEVLTT